MGGCHISHNGFSLRLYEGAVGNPTHKSFCYQSLIFRSSIFVDTNSTSPSILLLGIASTL